ncbi:allophanate hydrolase [Acinetobacter larvae]|uniref:Allophanate hydrolase n=1 Tax=Acinetobacter larvae TaxID=1789224 RepID=A0A1B2LYY1_9GAMM|nr:allophanate hydrolase [Acinetobacter larvae]AOA58150.1 allophanate hydrolase [Acinetobacter larvae]
MSQHILAGWTIAEWQHAYRHSVVQLDDLIDYVATWPADDPAWISLASAEQIRKQIDDLKQHIGQDIALPAAQLLQRWPLFGIPFAVKDNIDVAGFVSTVGIALAQHAVQVDAEAVRLLKQAGAIVVAKTNLDQFATGLVGTRSPFGAVPNSFNADYISGGSSSGSASVVARGFVPFALATDTAGSGRVPAAFNNIVGLKPTKGRFSNRGVFPACKSLDCIAVFALTVTDVALVGHLLEAYDVHDSYSRRHPQNTAAKFAPPVHFAIPQQLDFLGDLDAEQAFAACLLQLQQLGVKITRIDFADFERLAAQLYEGAWVAERTAAVEPYLLHDAKSFDATVLEIIGKGYDFSAIDAYRALYLQQDLARCIQQTLSQFDALLVPTAATIYRLADIAAQPIQRNADLGRYTNFTNLADLSALALPAGFRADGLPFGISLIANAWYDQALLDFGIVWQQHLALPLGALRKEYQPSMSTQPLLVEHSPHHVSIAVVGAHLSGMPLNYQLTSRQAVYIETTYTAAQYSLYALSGTDPAKPGLVRQKQPAYSIEVEIWQIPKAYFGAFVAEIPAPLAIGNLELIDGRWVKGFICENYAIESAEDISTLSGWRYYIEQQSA